MKLFKKIFLGMLAVVMVLSLNMTAFASTADTQSADALSTNQISPAYSTYGSVPSMGNIKIESVAHFSDRFVLRSAKTVTVDLTVVSRTSGASMAITLYNANNQAVDYVIVTSSGNYNLQAPTGGTYFVVFKVRLGSSSNYFVINYNINF